MPAHVFRSETASNVLLSATRYSEGMALQSGPHVPFFGATRNSNWSWPLGASDFQGRAVARLDPVAGVGGTVTFRVIAGQPDTGELLWETAVTLSLRRREVVIPFTLQPAGRPLWLQTVLDDGGTPGTLSAGWREMRITHATESDRSPPRPFGRGLRKVIRQSGEEAPDSIWYARGPQALEPEGWTTVPAQNWRWFEAPQGRVRIEVEINPNPANPSDPVVVTLAWYRAGRFEIMTEQRIDLRTTRRVTLEAPVTEPVGWVGLLTRPAGGRGANHAMKIISWEAR